MHGPVVHPITVAFIAWHVLQVLQRAFPQWQRECSLTAPSLPNFRRRAVRSRNRSRQHRAQQPAQPQQHSPTSSLRRLRAQAENRT